MKNLFEVEIKTGATGAKTAALTEASVDASPPVPAEVGELVECMYAGGYDGYREQSFEDKLRQAVGMIRGAIMDEAHKGLGDDGKVAKKYDPGDNPWSALEKMLAKAVYPDQFKPLVAKARAELDKYYE
jgi:hypothetical protein